MKKRISMILLCFVLMTGLLSGQLPEAAAAEGMNGAQVFENIDYEKAPYIRVILDGEQIGFDVYPQIVQGRTLVPMRTMLETFGLTVTWDEATKTVEAISSDSAISLTIGSNKAIFNEEEFSMSVPASIIQGRTMIPLRFFSENMGYNVVWVQGSSLILISKSDIVEWRYDGFEEVLPYKEFEAKFLNGVKLEDRRYNGKNHEVINYNLYSRDGREIPNVPDFKIPHYGTGWYKTSPFTGNVYWVDIDTLTSTYGNSKFFHFDDFTPIKAGMLRESAPIGNYIKIKIEEHGFDLQTWNKIAFTPESAISGVQDEKMLDGKIISNSDTIFKVTINDRLGGFMTQDAFINGLIKREANKVYDILVKDPITMFNWDDSVWNRLKGENPWAGMTKDMFLVQKQWEADKKTKLVTNFSTLELYVYQSQYTESIYYFDDEILIGMW